MTDPAPSPDPLDTAWRIHATLVDWTGKADTKATFTLAIESAMTLAVTNLSGTGQVLSDPSTPLVRFLLWAGVVSLAAGILTVMLAVRPQLRKEDTDDEWLGNFVYFGHLRHWSADDLEQKLRTADPLAALSRQLVEMSTILWRKNHNVQRSLALSSISSVAFLLAGVLN